MTQRFDEARFRGLWRGADETLQLQEKAQLVFQRRSATSFDGLGHLLDQLLPDDTARLDLLANALRLPVHHLVLLRSGSVDPLGFPPDVIVMLGKAAGLDCETLMRLVTLDHARFPAQMDIPRGDNVFGNPSDQKLMSLRSMWKRMAQDDPSEL